MAAFHDTGCVFPGVADGIADPYHDVGESETDETEVLRPPQLPAAQDGGHDQKVPEEYREGHDEEHDPKRDP